MFPDEAKKGTLEQSACLMNANFGVCTSDCSGLMIAFLLDYSVKL